jgi:phosphate transport system substrate-binding protein
LAITLAGAMFLPTALTLLAPGAPARASTASRPELAEITGDGSTWAANAVNQWIANVAQQGVQVVFTGDGSAAGRQDFALGTVDFAVSDIGYQGFDPVTGTNDSSKRPYAYLPVTAGGTSFPYNITVGGKRITNLRLSGQVIAEIFTNHITNWDNSAITADNNGHALPSLPITTVVPSEGSGTTAMFTQYLVAEDASLWKAFNGGIDQFTEYWPKQGANQIAQDGSSAIMDYIESSAANGSIGIDEYSYPLSAGFPVVQMENSAGYYVLPTEYNVAVALTKAHINTDKSSKNYLLETLNKVYTYNDPRTYPLSSYSYTIMPTSPTDPRMEVSAGQFPAKWQTLADFLYYSICQGQEGIGPIGYSALPVNLVEAGFQQIDKIKKAAPKVQIGNQNVTTCHNPTFVEGHPDENYLAKIAPQPPECDKTGHGPCSGILNGNANGGKGSSKKKGSGKSGNSGNSGNGNSGNGNNGGSSNGGTSGSNGGTSGSNGGTSGSNGGTSGSNGGTPAGTTPGGAVPVTLAAGQSSNLDDFLAPIAVVLLLTALILPPILRRRWSRLP